MLSMTNEDLDIPLELISTLKLLGYEITIQESAFDVTGQEARPVIISRDDVIRAWQWRVNRKWQVYPVNNPYQKELHKILDPYNDGKRFY